MKELKCPICQSHLVETHRGRYETLTEHVECSSASMKAGLQCSDIECQSRKLGAVWIDDGSLFINPDLPDVIEKSWLTADTMMNAACNNNPNAIDSFTYNYRAGEIACDKKRREFEFGKFLLKIEPKQYGYNYPDKMCYQPKPFSYKFEFYKRTSTDGYSRVKPIWTDVLWYINRFKDMVTEIKGCKTPSRYTVKNAIISFSGMKYMGNEPDERLYVRIGAWIIRKFYSKEVLYILEVAQKMNL